MYALWDKIKMQCAIDELQQVLCNLQWILCELIDEQTRSDRAVKNKKCRLQKKSVNRFEYFTSKGIICLYMANKFYEWNRKSCTIFGWLMRNMDIYTRLRKEFERIMYNIAQLAERKMIHDEDFIIFTENDMRSRNGEFANIDRNKIIEFEANEIDECYGWIYKVGVREGLLIGIETKFNEIQEMFFKRCFLLYHELNDYCTELRQYLYTNKHTLKSCKFYRKENLAQFICCKYHLLKLLLEGINKQGKHIAKYDTAYKGNRWN